MSIPSLIGDDIEKSFQIRSNPLMLKGTNLNPQFHFSEGLIPFIVTIIPTPKCTCVDFRKSKHNVCHHIIKILRHYYKINNLSIVMYHKIPETFYIKLVSYIDSWLTKQRQPVMTDNQDMFYRKPKAKLKNKSKNFYQETKKLCETPENNHILNPTYSLYAEEECAICSDYLNNKQPLIICLSCCNYSHQKCDRLWRQKGNGCHLCRNGATKKTKNTNTNTNNTNRLPTINKEEEFPALA